MNRKVRPLAFRILSGLVVAAALFSTPSAGAYSVLSHEEVVDMAWKVQIVPMLKARFPGISDDDIRQAHAYAYGGSVIQDIGYYPFGSHYFSDLLHYVRPGDFVNALIRDSTTPDEYAFALGALAHYCGDTVGHPYINQITASENPPLRQRFGSVVTYGEDPTAHLRTEFGFDVVEVAHGHYSQENYRDFIGFQVSKSLLEKAFLETYGIRMDAVIKHEDLAINTYRKAVSMLIPKMTKVAFVSYKNDIQQASPGMQKSKFMYRLNQTEYNKSFGTDYTHVGKAGQVLAFVLRFVPKIGPFKALKVTVPDAQQQTVYLKSVNETVDAFKADLAQIHAAPAPLPIPDPKDAVDARKAADKVSKDADKAVKLADKATDPQDKAKKQEVAAKVEKIADKADNAATRTEAKVEAAQTNPDAAPSDSPRALPPGSPIEPPTTPKLAELDMDTGKPSNSGEYNLADQTYAHLLSDLVKPAAPVQPAATAAAGTPKPGVVLAATNTKSDLTPQDPTPGPHVDPLIAADIDHFFASRVAPTGPPPSAKIAKKQTLIDAQVKADLATLKTLEAAPLAAPTANAESH
jgi:hypothetical protein